MTPLVALPGFTFVGWLIIAVAVAWFFAFTLCRARGRSEERYCLMLADEAADHDEPSRSDVEATWTREALERVIVATENPWLFDAPEFSETPIHDEIAVERLRSELDCESAVVLWLSRGA